jgi:putative aldouronate transport system substrate-binding protein
MVKRTSAILKITMIVIALAIFATACAQAPAPAPTQPTATTAAPVSAPPPAGATVAATKAAAPTTVPTESKPVDIELWAQPSVTEQGPPPADWIVYKILKEKYNINLKLVLTPTGADGEAKYNAAAAANSLPDLMQIVSAATDNRGVMVRFQKLGLLAPVNTLLPLMPERSKTHYGDANVMKVGLVGGVQYGLVEPRPIPRREGLVIRKDWLTKLGLKEPTTLDEMLAVAQAFTDKDPDGNGKADTYGVGGFINGVGLGDRFDWIIGAYELPGIWDVRNPSTIQLNVRDPNYPKALAFFNKLVTAKVIDPDWPTLKRDDFRARWKQGRFGIMWEDFSALASQSNYTAFDKNFPEGEWVPLAALKGPDGKPHYVRVDQALSNIFCVSKKAADAGKGPAIARLLEWMATKEGYMLIGWGEEGKQYKLDKDGKIVFDGLDPKLVWQAPESQMYTQLRNNMAFTNTPEELAIRYTSFKSINGRTISQMQFLTFFQAQPWVDGAALQIINPHPKAADFNRFYGENIVQFALGQKPLTDQAWADYLKGLDGLGAKEWEASAKKDLQDSGAMK